MYHCVSIFKRNTKLLGHFEQIIYQYQLIIFFNPYDGPDETKEIIIS